jgi:hypothetical protein
LNLLSALSVNLDLSNFVFLVGLSQMANIPAMMLAPKMLGWKEDLGKLRPINRAIVIVLGIGMSLIIVGTGIVVMVGKDELVNGSLLGISLSCFLAVVWTYRGLIQILVYPRIWPRGGISRMSHFGLMGLFVFQFLAYWILFVKGVIKRIQG